MKRLTLVLAFLLVTSCSTPEDTVSVTGDISTDAEQRKKQVVALSSSYLDEAIDAQKYIHAVEAAQIYIALEEEAQLERERIAAAEKAEREAAERLAQAQKPPPNNSPPSYSAPENSSGGDCGGWDSMIIKHFGALQPACRVMMCESGGYTHAYNGKYGASGLFQIISSWSDEFTAYTGVPYYDGRFSAEPNMRFAAYLVRDSGWASQFDCY